MKSGDSRFDRVDTSIERLEDKLGEMSKDLTTIKTKVTVYGALSAAIVTLIGTIISNKGL